MFRVSFKHICAEDSYSCCNFMYLSISCNGTRLKNSSTSQPSCAGDKFSLIAECCTRGTVKIQLGWQDTCRISVVQFMCKLIYTLSVSYTVLSAAAFPQDAPTLSADGQAMNYRRQCRTLGVYLHVVYLQLSIVQQGNVNFSSLTRH